VTNGPNLDLLDIAMVLGMSVAAFVVISFLGD
jgi:hypothetical protein